MGNKRCAIKECTKQIPWWQLVCSSHWELVPPKMGLENDSKQPKAQRLAIVQAIRRRIDSRQVGGPTFP